MSWDLTSICEIISLFLTFLSAFFFAPQLMRTDEELDQISRTHGSPNPYSYDAINPHMKSALIKDRRNAQIGLCLLSLGIGFQMFSIYLNK